MRLRTAEPHGRQSLHGLPTPSGAPHGRGDQKPQGGAQHLLLARTSMHRHHARVP